MIHRDLEEEAKATSRVAFTILNMSFNWALSIQE